METRIVIDKNSESPVYRQIIEQVAGMVRAGVYRSGDRLPTERELAVALGVARGTVNRAYEELTRSQILESIPGRGSFISARQDVVETGRKEQAVTLIADLVDQLRELRFSYREIRNLVELGILEKEHAFDEFAIAVVDCNPEALAVFQKQLQLLSHLPVTLFLLDELAGAGDADRRLAVFDLILTSARHYSELLGLAPHQKDRVVQVALSPSQQTIISLASVKPGRRIGLVYRSRQFREIILNKLHDLMIEGPFKETSGSDADGLADFIADLDLVIVPPGWQPPSGTAAQAALQGFADRGGAVIVFDYQVERGSMIYVEERVRDLLSR